MEAKTLTEEWEEMHREWKEIHKLALEALALIPKIKYHLDIKRSFLKGRLYELNRE